VVEIIGSLFRQLLYIYIVAFNSIPMRVSMKEKTPFRTMKVLLDFTRDEIEMYWSAFRAEAEIRTDAKIGDDPIDKLIYYLILKGVLDYETK